MKSLLISLMALFPIISLSAQTTITNNPLNEFIGDTITITDLYYDSDVLLETPDTIWIKRVRRPKEGKHYELQKFYKKANRYIASYSPKALVEDKNFQLLAWDSYKYKDVFSDEFKISPILHLIDTETQEKVKIIFRKNKSAIEFFSHNKSRLNDVAKSYTGKTFYKKKSTYSDPADPDNYETIKCTHCISRCQHIKNEEFKSYIYAICDDGFSFNINDKSNFDVITENEYNKIIEEDNKTKAFQGSYLMFLDNIKKNGKTLTKYYKIDSSTELMTYEDQNVRIQLEPHETSFYFTLYNKTAKSIKIDWNEIVFIDEHNKSQKITHEGVRYMDAENYKAPSTVAPYSELEDCIIPANRLFYGSYSHEWSVLAILNYVNDLGKYEEGTPVRIYLPLKINDTLQEFIFTYKISWRYKYPELFKKYSIE